MVQEPIKSIKKLTKEEERILEMYSRGESYEVIQENLFVEHGMNYNNKKLGHKMGEIKKKLKCETQFQMGYLYGKREEEILTPKERIRLISDPKEYHKGLDQGLVWASIWWLIIFAIVSNYVL